MREKGDQEISPSNMEKKGGKKEAGWAGWGGGGPSLFLHPTRQPLIRQREARSQRKAEETEERQTEDASGHRINTGHVVHQGYAGEKSLHVHAT